MIRMFVMLCVSLWVSLAAVAARSAEMWHTSTLKYVYPMANGDFVIVLDSDSPDCPATGPGKYLRVNAGENGVTVEGSKKLYALVLTAMISRNPVTVAFDNATIDCYVNRATINP